MCNLQNFVFSTAEGDKIFRLEDNNLLEIYPFVNVFSNDEIRDYYSNDVELEVSGTTNLCTRNVSYSLDISNALNSLRDYGYYYLYEVNSLRDIYSFVFSYILEQEEVVIIDSNRSSYTCRLEAEYRLSVYDIDEYGECKQKACYYKLILENLSLIILPSNFTTHLYLVNRYKLYLQSGLEEEEEISSKDYSRSKFTTKEKRNSSVIEKVSKELAKIALNPDVGTKNKKKRRNFKKKIKHLKMQAGLEDSSVITKFLSGALSSIEYEKCFKALETFALMYVAKNSESTIASLFSILLLVIKDLFSKSIFQKLSSLLSSLPCAASRINEITEWFKQASLEMASFKKNKYAMSFMAAMSTLSSVIICPSIARLCNNVLVDHISKAISSFDFTNIIAMIVDCGTYISNAIRVFLSTGELSGFIYTDNDLHEITQQCIEIKLNFDQFKLGVLENRCTLEEGSNTAKFYKSIEDVLGRISDIRSSVSGNALRDLNNMFKDVKKIQNDMILLQKSKTARICPFVFCLSSGSGINKSHLTKLIAHSICRKNNIPIGEQYEHYINENDKFFSGATNAVTVFYLDDAGNALFEPGGGSLNVGNFLLKSANNVLHNLEMADVEFKGRIFNNSMVNAINTNTSYLATDERNRYPSSQMRRIHLYLTAVPRPQYRADGGVMIDYSKVPRWERSQIAPDLWYINAYKVALTPVAEREIKTSYHDVPREPPDSLWRLELIKEDASIYEIMDLAGEMAAAHYANQEGVLNVNRDLYDDSQWCESTGNIRDLCSCYSCRPRSCHSDSDSVSRTSEDLKELIDFSGPDLDDESSLTESEDIPDLHTQYGQDMPALSILLDRLDSFKTPDMQDTFASALELASIGKLTFLKAFDLLKEKLGELLAGFMSYVLNKFADLLLNLEKVKYSLMPLQMERTFFSRYIYSGIWGYSTAIRLDQYMTLSIKLLTLGKMFYNSFIFSNLARRYTSFMVKNNRNGLFSLSLGASNLLSTPPTDWEEKIDYITTPIYEFKKDNPNVYRDKYTPAFISMFVSSVLAPKVIKQLSSNYVKTQGGLDISANRMKEFDSDVNTAWFKHRIPVVLDVPPIEVKVTYSELYNTVSKNTVYVRNNKGVFCNGLLLCSEILLMPLHVYREMCTTEENVFLTLYRKPIIEVDGKKIPGNAIISNIPVSEFNSVSIPTSDMLMIRSPRIGPVSDITKYISDERMSNYSHGILCHRNKLGQMTQVECTNISYSKFKSEIGEFDGLVYNSNNFNGLCGSPLIDTARKHSFILGFHGAGSGTGVSASLVFKKVEIDSMLSRLLPRGLVQQSGFNLECFGKDIFQSGLNVNSPLLSVPRELECMQVYGSVSIRNTPDDKVCKTLICDDLAELIPHGYSWGSPPIHGIDGSDKRYPIRRFLDIYSTKSSKVDMENLHWAYQDYILPLLNEINTSEVWKLEIRPLNDVEVVQGIDGKKYVNHLNMSSSMGKHLSGNKSKYAVQQPDGKWIFEKFVMEEFHKRDSKWRKCQRTFEPVFMLPKIEPTELDKIKRGKCRVFYACGTVTQMLIRKYSLTIVRFLCMLTSTSEVAVGTNPHSLRWNEIALELKKVKGGKYVAWDFSDFDIRVPPEVLSKALDIICELAISSGNYSQEDLNATEVLKIELLHSVVDLNGDLTLISGLISSGNNLTSALGCIVNSLYMRMSFYIIYKSSSILKNKRFKDVVTLLTFGDDSIGAVSKAYPEFNVQSVIEALHTFGIIATNCEKNSNSVKYYSLEQLEFLKRKFVFNKDFGVVVAPLSLKSIYKQLSCVLPPTTNGLNLASLTANNVDGALFELKFHGRKAFEYHQRVFLQLCTKHGIAYMCKLLFKTYDELVLEWQQQYVTPLDTKNSDFRVQSVEEFIRLWSDVDCNTEQIADHVMIQNSNKNNEIMELNQSLPKLVDPDRSNIILSKQSGIETQPVVSFVGERVAPRVEIQSNMDSRVSDAEVSLKEFLARPVRIADYEWSNIVFSQDLDVWGQYFLNKRVANRLNNYQLLRGNLHFKILINGNGFYFGRLIASYLPLHLYDQLTAATAFLEVDLVQLSNMPHLYLDPTTSTAGSMVVPCYTPLDYIDLTGVSTRDIGRLMIREMSPLRHANSTITASDRVTITIYAWMENVELQAPTNFNMPGLTAQSGRELETEDKPISQLATSVADACSIASKIPIIGPYAESLEKGARMTSSVASALGYCEPTVVKEPEKVAIRNCSNMATTNTADTSEKLTYDVKQSITIDPASIGLPPIDEMSFAYIAGKESYLSKFTWTVARDPDAFLWNTRVAPSMWRYNAADGAIGLTAVGGLSIPFRYWTGSMIYKFVFVASNFHRGKVAITYDPYATQDVILNAREDNTSITKIVDLAETREFEIEVANHNSLGMLPLSKSFLTAHHSSSTLFSGPLSGFNGTILVSVVNALTVPNLTTPINPDIEVLVFVKGGKDLTFGGSSSAFSTLCFKPQSGRETADTINANALETPMSTSDGGKVPSYQNQVFMGESITSLRALLKRFAPYRSIPFTLTTQRAILLYHPIYPLSRGKVAGAIDGLNNYVFTTLINFFMAAYSGARGGTRYKIAFAHNCKAFMEVSRINFDSYSYALINEETTKAAVEGNRYQPQGTVVFDCNTNAITEFEVPFYSEYKFLPGKAQDYANTLIQAGFLQTLYIYPDANASPAGIVKYYVSASEDFSLHFFTGWPRCYNVTSFP